MNPQPNGERLHASTQCGNLPFTGRGLPRDAVFHPWHAARHVGDDGQLAQLLPGRRRLAAHSFRCCSSSSRATLRALAPAPGHAGFLDQPAGSASPSPRRRLGAAVSRHRLRLVLRDAEGLQWHAAAPPCRRKPGALSAHTPVVPLPVAVAVCGACCWCVARSRGWTAMARCVAGWTAVTGAIRWPAGALMLGWPLAAGGAALDADVVPSWRHPDAGPIADPAAAPATVGYGMASPLAGCCTAGARRAGYPAGTLGAAPAAGGGVHGVCLYINKTQPLFRHAEQPKLIFALAYVASPQTWSFAITGAALRFLSRRTLPSATSPMRPTGSTSCTCPWWPRAAGVGRPLAAALGAEVPLRRDHKAWRCCCSATTGWCARRPSASCSAAKAVPLRHQGEWLPPRLRLKRLPTTPWWRNCAASPKRYGTLEALSRVDLDLKRGELLALLGAQWGRQVHRHLAVAGPERGRWRRGALARRGAAGHRTPARPWGHDAERRAAQRAEGARAGGPERQLLPAPQVCARPWRAAASRLWPTGSTGKALRR